MRADDRVFDCANHAVGNQALELLRREVILELHVGDDRFPAGIGKAADSDLHALGCRGEGKRQDHCRRKAARLDGRRLVHQLAVVRPARGDDPTVRRCQLLQHVKNRGEFAGGKIIEIGVSAIEQRRRPALLQVADELAVLFRRRGQIGVAAERRDGDDGTPQKLRRDRTNMHGQLPMCSSETRLKIQSNRI
jgi:hypothetical protein